MGPARAPDRLKVAKAARESSPAPERTKVPHGRPLVKPRLWGASEYLWPRTSAAGRPKFMTQGESREAPRWPADSLEGMPPKRKRLIVWGLLGYFLLQFIAIGLRAAGLPRVVTMLVVVAAVAAIFIPLGRAAWLELQQQRAEGLEPPPKPVTKRSLIVLAVFNVIFWAGTVWYMVAYRELLIPVVPIWLTVVTVIQFRRWRAQTAAG
jgi:hypothetical protein